MSDIIDALAIYRLARLATVDTLTAPARSRLVRAIYERDESDRAFASSSLPPEEWPTVDPDPPRLATLITCPWCASVWVAAGVLVARRFAPRLWDPVARLLAGAAVAGLLASWED